MKLVVTMDVIRQIFSNSDYIFITAIVKNAIFTQKPIPIYNFKGFDFDTRGQEVIH